MSEILFIKRTSLRAKNSNNINIYPGLPISSELLIDTKCLSGATIPNKNWRLLLRLTTD